MNETESLVIFLIIMAAATLTTTLECKWREDCVAGGSIKYIDFCKSFNDQKDGQYTAIEENKKGCSNDGRKIKCCKPTGNTDCKWTKGCTDDYPGNLVGCEGEFPKLDRIWSGKRHKNDSSYGSNCAFTYYKRYECCK